MKTKAFSLFNSSTFFLAVLFIVLVISACTEKITFTQPELGIRTVKLLEDNGFQFKDLNKNGKLDKYEDWRLPVDERVADLKSQMTIEEKVGHDAYKHHRNGWILGNGKNVAGCE